MIAMGPQEDYIETVVTCEGDFHDPELHSRLEQFRLNLKELLSTDSNKVILKKVEPWNSVRVTFNIPKEAALRLKQLAEQGNAALRSLGVLAVQIEGDQIISLTIAGRNNERAEVILKTNDTNRPGPSSVSVFDSGLHSSDEVSSPGASNVETTRKNIAEYLRKGTSLFDTFFNPNQSVHGSEVFRSPNVVATSCEPIPFKANNILHTTSSHSTIPGMSPTHVSFPPGRSPTGYPATHSPNFPSPSSSRSPVGQPALKFPSPPAGSRGIIPLPPPPPPPHSFANMGLPPPPPYPQTMAPVNNLPRHGKTVTAASPLLVNLLQTEPLVAGLSNMAGQKMLPPNEGGGVVKKKRRPRKPKDTNKPATPVDGEIPIESIPNPALDVTGSISSSDSVVSVSHSEAISRIPFLTHQTSMSNHTQGAKDSVNFSNFMENDSVLSSGTSKLNTDDPFPPEVTAGKIVNPYTGKLEPIDKISDLSPNKTKPVGRSIEDPIMSEKISSSVHLSDRSISDIKKRIIGPSVGQDPFIDCVAATRTSSLTTHSISPISNNNPLTSTVNSGHIYADNSLSSVSSVTMDIYAADCSSQQVNTTPGRPGREDICGQPAVQLESVAYSGAASVPKLANSLSNSSVMHTLSATYCLGTTTSQASKKHNALVVSSTLTSSTVSSAFSSQDSSSEIYTQGIQSHAKLDSLPSLNSPNVRNTEVHSITGSPNGKVSCEGDDGSNHSGIINDINPEGATSTVSPLDSSGNKVYNHDSGVGSSSERSDDTPSEPGDEFRSTMTTQVHVEVASEDCLKGLKYSAECKNSKVMTVGYVMNHEQSSATPQNIANSIGLLNKDPLSKMANTCMKEFDQYLYGGKQNNIALNSQIPSLNRTDKEQHFNHINKKLKNGPSMLNEHNSTLDVKTDEVNKAKSQGFNPSINSGVTVGMGTGMMKDKAMYLKGDTSIAENGPTRSKHSEKKKGLNSQSRSNSPRQAIKEADTSISSSYNNYTNDWPDLSNSLFGMGQINTDHFDSHHFEGLEFDSPPNSEKFAGFTEQDILQATAKGLACKALDGTKGSNITSKYSKRSSPVNVNMLNHLYAPGLPLPRRLTESVQRLVKPLPSNDHSLPHSRACKSPGSSKSSNGSASPRSGPGGARSPGANVSKSGNGVGQSVNNLSGQNSATSQQYTMAGNLTNTTINNNSHTPQLMATSCSINNLSLSSSTDSHRAIGDSTYQAYNNLTTQDNYNQYHSNSGSTVTNYDPQMMARDQLETSNIGHCATSPDYLPSQVETVPSSVCNMSVNSDIGAGLPTSQDSSTENQDNRLSANLCAMEQNKSYDLNKSASEKTCMTSGSPVEHNQSVDIKTKFTEGSGMHPSVETISLSVNKHVSESESRSDSLCVPPFVSSSLQHSTYNLSGSALTTQTSVSFSRQHGVSLSSIDIAKTIPSPPLTKKLENVQNLSQFSDSTSAQNVNTSVKEPDNENVNNSDKLSPIVNTDLCSQNTSDINTPPSITHSNTNFTNVVASDKQIRTVVNTSNESTLVPVGDLSKSNQSNHINEEILVNSIDASETTATTIPSSTTNNQELENTPPLVAPSEIFTTSSVESESPMRRLTRKRKSNNSESECTDPKEAKMLDETQAEGNEGSNPASHNAMVIYSNTMGEENSEIKSQDKVGLNDETSNIEDGKDDDIMSKRGRRHKPLAPATVIGYSFFDTPVIQGRTRSQSSTTPATEKTDQKEDVPVTTPKRSTRSIKQKDQSEAPASKRRRSRDHR
ncbi:uncharacterized protein LOC126819159 isoform X1 [Patella vulgata]|uniref:uncharacterized protein LOC126819159 isoform X1 n=1 Tax=Patella vulgata TaxID=6465 RepID=UPI0024A7BE66|nr:uncharacterized protein LOC126819159 isoform X1 [Patella vulgata]